MRDTIEFDKSSFEEDELLLLVLSYVSKYSGKFSEGKKLELWVLWTSCRR